jgi:hypothetical protein
LSGRAKQAPRGRASGHGLRALVLHAEFNARIVGGLVAGARRVLLDAGVEALDEVAVPGAFELPAAASAAAASARYDLVVALGAVIRGETDHYEHVARAAAARPRAPRSPWCPCCAPWARAGAADGRGTPQQGARVRLPDTLSMGRRA